MNFGENIALALNKKCLQDFMLKFHKADIDLMTSFQVFQASPADDLQGRSTSIQVRSADDLGVYSPAKRLKGDGENEIKR